MAKTIRVLTTSVSFSPDQMVLSPNSRAMYGYASSVSAPRWVRIPVNPTGSQTAYALNPVPSASIYANAWTPNGQYLLLGDTSISIYHNNGTNVIPRVFNDTCVNIFGSTFIPKTVTWFNDNEHFWIAGNTVASTSITGVRTAYLCRYNPVANTITVLDSWTAGADIAFMDISPDERYMAARIGNNIYIFNILPNRRIGSEVFNVATGTARYFCWHPSGRYFAQQITTSVRIYTPTGTLAATAPAAAIFGWLNGGRSLIGIPASTTTLWGRDFNVATGALTTWSGATLPTIASAAKPDFNGISVRHGNDAYGEICMIQHNVNSSQMLLASESFETKLHAVAPLATFAGISGFPNTGNVLLVSPEAQAEILANRNEYLSMDAVSFPSVFSGEFTSLYGMGDFTAPLSVMDGTAIILDEPYEPFEYRAHLNNAAMISQAPSGFTVSSEAADPFAYGDWLAPEAVMDGMMVQPTTVVAEMTTGMALFAGTVGDVPYFTGDFVAQASTFSALVPMLPTGDVDLVTQEAVFEAEGLLPSDVAILEAVSFAPELAAEAFAPPAGMMEAVSFASTMEASVDVPVGAFMEAVVEEALFDGETFSPIGSFIDMVAGTSIFEGQSNVPVGVYLESTGFIPTMDGLINNPQLAIGEFVAQPTTMDAFVGVGSEMTLDAVARPATAQVNAIFRYEAVLEAITEPAQFEALPPEPYEVVGDFESYAAQADFFGGPWVMVDVEPVAPAATLDVMLLKAGQIDANLRSYRAVFDGLANIQVSGELHMISEPTVFDAFVGQTVEADVAMMAPQAIMAVNARFGDSGGDGPFTIAYQPSRDRRRPFSPIRARFG